MPFQPGLHPPAVIERRAWFVAHATGLVLREHQGALHLPYDDELEALGGHADGAEYLGILDGTPAFFAHIEAIPPPPYVVRNLRGLHGVVDDATFAVGGRAMHLRDWAVNHRFCGRCATPMVRAERERAMRCPACGLTQFPRISPAIIVLVRRGHEALLARGTRFPVPYYSTLAGFSEVGESLEETLVREVHEEVGVRVRNPRYFGSQPWPFPNSLMIGFFADYESGEIRVDPEEIVDAKWVRADQLPLIPPPLSIARQLIDAWVKETLKPR